MPRWDGSKPADETFSTWDGHGPGTRVFNNLSDIGGGSTGVRNVDGKEMVTRKMAHTLP